MRLLYQSFWYHDQYYVVDSQKINKVQISDLTRVEINTKIYKVQSRDVTVHYNDMGHSDSSRSKHYFIMEMVFGMEMEFDLNTICDDVVVFALDYVVKPS